MTEQAGTLSSADFRWCSLSSLIALTRTHVPGQLNLVVPRSLDRLQLRAPTRRDGDMPRSIGERTDTHNTHTHTTHAARHTSTRIAHTHTRANTRTADRSPRTTEVSGPADCRRLEDLTRCPTGRGRIPPTCSTRPLLACARLGRTLCRLCARRQRCMLVLVLLYWRDPAGVHPLDDRWHWCDWQLTCQPSFAFTSLSSRPAHIVLSPFVQSLVPHRLPPLSSLPDVC